MMGGSLAHTLKRKKICKKIFAYDTNIKSLTYGKKYKIIDDYDFKDFTLIQKSDLVIICAPIRQYKKIFNIISKKVTPDAIITDIGSIKSNITESIKVTPNSFKKRFIGSHPLTGSEKYGVENFKTNLYNGQYVLISQYNTDRKLFNTIKIFWEKVGCKSILIKPKQHDSLLSLTSHLPHIASFVLVKEILSKCPPDQIESYTGGGFRDFARLANSDSTMWEGIISLNSANILKSIDSFVSEMKNFRKIIKKGKPLEIKNYINKIHKKINS